MGGIFDKERKQIERVVKQIMTDMSKHIAKELTNESVPVRTGHYVASHTVQVTTPEYPRFAAPSEPPFAPLLSGSASEPYRKPVEERLKAKSKALIEKNEKIYFGNRASYAHLVEFLGWTDIGGQTGRYFIFGKAAQSLNLQKKAIITIAKKKVFK